MCGHGPATQIVAISEATGKNDQIAPRHIRVAVPDADRLTPDNQRQRSANIALAVRARKYHDDGSHRETFANIPVTYSGADDRSRRRTVLADDRNQNTTKIATPTS